MNARIRSLTRLGAARYLMVFEQADGREMQFHFQVRTEPIPVVVWGDEFEQFVGTLGAPAPEILELVLRFHHVCKGEVPMRHPQR